MLETVDGARHLLFSLFLPRCMECRRGLAMKILPVRPSVNHGIVKGRVITYNGPLIRLKHGSKWLRLTAWENVCKMWLLSLLTVCHGIAFENLCSCFRKIGVWLTACASTWIIEIHTRHHHARCASLGSLNRTSPVSLPFLLSHLIESDLIWYRVVLIANTRLSRQLSTVNIHTNINARKWLLSSRQKDVSDSAETTSIRNQALIHGGGALPAPPPLFSEGRRF